jgi:phage terminase small subunit
MLQHAIARANAFVSLSPLVLRRGRDGEGGMTGPIRARMTPRQRRFISEYLVDLNATQAAIRAGYSKRRATATGWDLLHKRPAIAAAISEAMLAREKRTLITADRVLQQFARIAFADIRPLAQLVEDGLEVKSLAALSDDLAAAVVELSANGKDVRLRLQNRIEALNALARHLGLFDKKPSRDEPASQHDEDRLPAREILRRKLAQLAGEEVPEE